MNAEFFRSQRRRGQLFSPIPSLIYCRSMQAARGCSRVLAVVYLAVVYLAVAVVYLTVAWRGSGSMREALLAVFYLRRTISYRQVHCRPHRTTFERKRNGQE